MVESFSQYTHQKVCCKTLLPRLQNFKEFEYKKVAKNIYILLLVKTKEMYCVLNYLVNQNSMEKEKKEADKEQHLEMVFFNPDLNRYKSWTLKP